METLWQDLRYGIRTLAKSPGFTAVAVLTLALGIGANTAIFSVVKTVLLSALPYRQPGRLVTLAASDRETLNPTNVSYGLVQDWKQRSHSFRSIALYRGWSATLTAQGKPQVLRGMRVSYDFFETLGVLPALGRSFQREEDRPDRWHVVLLSYGFWKQHFAGQGEVVGHTILLNQTSFLIVGVLPENFQPLIFRAGARPPEVWALLGYDASLPYACRSCQHLQSVARLQDGVTLEQARAEMNRIASNLAREFPQDYPPEFSVVITPLRDQVVGKVRAALWLLLGATTFVLLIACVNVTNLLLSRGVNRRREMALRAALGASRLRLGRQLLTEGMLLTLLGGAGGVLLAVWGVGAIAISAPVEIPRVGEVQVDPGVLLFTLVVSVAAGLLSGLVPALRAARADQREALQEGARGTVGPGHKAVRGVLIASEVALAFVLAVGTGLLLKSLVRVLGVNPGFEPRNLYTANFALIGPKYAQDAAVVQFAHEALERIRALPGVEAAAIVSTLPIGGGWDRRGFHIHDRHLAADSEAPSVDGYFVSPDYFRAMGIPIRRGRVFTEADLATPSAPVAVISELTAQQMWPGEDPLGKQIQLGGRNEKKPWATIVGIAGDVRQYGLDSAATPDAYLLYTQEPLSSPTLVVRSRLATTAVARAIEKQVAALDKDVPVYGFAPMGDLIASSVAQRQLVTTLVGSFGVLALVLAAIGIYGVTAHSVTQRTSEIGIRMALGARPGDVLRLVLGHGLRPALVGVVFGAAAALLLTRLLSSLLFSVRPADPLTFAGVALLLGAVALAACYVPARRATRVDPMVALRYE